MAPVKEPRWLKVRDDWKQVESRRLEPLADLRRALLEEAERWKAQGWTIEGDGGQSNWGAFYMNRDGVRWYVYISPTEARWQDVR